MMLKVDLSGKRSEVMLPMPSTAEDLLAELCLLPDAHIVLRNDVPIPIDEPLKEGDLVRIIRVASGG